MHARDRTTPSAPPVLLEAHGPRAPARRAATGRPAARVVARLPWALLAVTVTLTALSQVLAAVDDFRSIPGRPAGLDQLIALIFLLYGAVGALIARRHPGNAVGWILCAVGALNAFAGFARHYALHALETRPGALPGGVVMAWLGNWVNDPFLFLAIAFLPLLFPDGRLPSRRWRPVAWLAALGTAMITLYDAFAPAPLQRWPALENPYAAPGRLGALLWWAETGYVLIPVCGLAAVASLLVRLRRARGDAHAQVQWFLLGAVAVVAGAAMVFALGAAGVPEPASLTPQWLSFAVIPVVVGVAILKYRLYDIDLVVNRALVYATLTALVVASYALAVTAAGAVARGDSVAVSLAATGLIAVLFQPARERVQRGVNRLLYGERDEPYRALSRLGRRLEGTLAPAAVLPTIVETVREALKVPYAAVALAGADGGAGAVAAASGAPTGELVAVPLVYRAEPVGELRLAPRAPSEAFGAADRRLLDDLARQAGVAVHAARLTADLRRSRERLVTAREEERRRLRRDLHDGLGPRLAGLTLRLETARNRLGHDPQADALLADLAERTRAAVGDIRRLVYALRPPALDDLGLVSALREGAAQYAGQGAGGLAVAVEAPEPLPPLPAAVEVAAYRIAQEALANVVRHARARRCTVRLDLDAAAGLLTVMVKDDGVGIEADQRPGVGLASMRERAEELGGSVRVETAPGAGTLVVAELPCQRPDAGAAP